LEELRKHVTITIAADPKPRPISVEEPDMVVEVKNDHHESVAHLYGLIVPILVEYHKTNNVRLVVDALNEVNPLLFPAEMHERLSNLYDRRVELTIREWMELTNCIAVHGGFHAGFHQIQSWDWVNTDYIQACVTEALRVIGKESKGKFESPVHGSVLDKLNLNGRIDFEEAIVDEKGEKGIRLWEFKLNLPNELSQAQLQVAIYACLNAPDYPSRLYCVGTGQLWDIEVEDEKKLLEVLVKHYLERK